MTNKKKRKGGVKKGATRKDKPQAHWFVLCERFEQSNWKSQAAFLRSENLPTKAMHFSRALKKYLSGKLKNVDETRVHDREYEAVEKKVVQYVDLREKLFLKDKCGLAWCIIQDKALAYAKAIGFDNTFRASPGWIANCLKRADKISINLHGEAMDLTKKEAEVLMKPWRKKLEEKIEKHNVPTSRIYNADQTGLYYTKLPNRMYVNKADRKDFAGCKQMKAKERITLMILVALNGAKGPLFVVGKAKKPVCFKHELGKDGKPPIAYKDQANAWFTREVTEWWILKVFWPWHVRTHGDVWGILLLDNCSAHHGLNEDNLPRKLSIIFFPANLTNRHQPCDMGIIAGVKVGYRLILLKTLLAIFDEKDGYEKAAKSRKKQPRGTKGVEYGGKPTVLDAMNMVLQVWNNDEKYATPEGVRRCWRKANILPPGMDQDINNEIGSASMPESQKKISEEESSELCDLLKKLVVVSDRYGEEQPRVLEESYASDRGREALSQHEIETMVGNWVSIEEDPNIQEFEFEEVLKKLEEELEGEKEEDTEDDEADADDPMVVDDTSDSDDGDGDDDSSLGFKTHHEVDEACRNAKKYARQKGYPKKLQELFDQATKMMREHRQKKQKQSPTITSYFKAKKK
jgi:hypothetical protein